MFCFIAFFVFALLVFFLIFHWVKTGKFLFAQISFFNVISLLVFFFSGFFTLNGIYNLIKYDACQKPEIIFKGEVGPLASEGKCPFAQNQDILCIFMDDVVLKKLNLPSPPNEIIFRIYKKLPTVLQWRIMTSAFQKLNPEDKKTFEKFLKEGDGYQIQLLFYNKIPDYKSIIDEELKKLREETLKVLYEENPTY